MTIQTTLSLILGGARSGKSRFAEQQAKENVTQGKRLHYIATATPFDDEMRMRIKHHQQQRGDNWAEHECALELANLLTQFTANDVVLVECLTLWLNNVIYALGEACSNEALEARITELVQAAKNSQARLIFVSNEVGMGVVPLGEVSRYFVDNAGRMNQQFAAIADEVTLVTAGLPLQLKGIAR
ncbi:bifunctional adenosylcobinamide kinase/adenosylcobinamide-phosphate guanylyltransferase [Photobacterium sp. WH77]|uniref:bifunctional adenosylcobinamide kinase/adenosylcobinamide-phosphate guanylyltransferase n=1 Tax=unclassified Photobacterium TaxID=2628852 RepID=UPI001EDBEBD2|nr:MULTISPECIES: bifunctional adenosylcobinamide kinase/adenosylcobinamide-phosphate guanylyltransferase [unclassified Photobacterium]MCG2839106.1 bifunctional adenosylcobinamide kinase/adenosylcobinamide-phosphate guanylyltransferase [Photobacterium sp. WH77]MCG2846751.1 bifunctional adenosylcobinamide kinase/adenosylcobinamide-phosphate guanylyltransferase [Photobacterium sp. WH80]